LSVTELVVDLQNFGGGFLNIAGGSATVKAPLGYPVGVARRNFPRQPSLSDQSSGF